MVVINGLITLVNALHMANWGPKMSFVFDTFLWMYDIRCERLVLHQLTCKHEAPWPT